MNLALFFLLSILYALEAITSLARMLGYYERNPAAGYTLQQSLSVFSRIVILVFMPLVGLLADRGGIKLNAGFFVGIMLPCIILWVVAFLRPQFTSALRISMSSIINEGYILSIRALSSRSKPGRAQGNVFQLSKTTKDHTIRKKLRSFYALYAFSYIPFYASWPTVFILLNQFPTHRALIIGLTTWFNGVNTIILTAYIDPFLARHGKTRRTIIAVYRDLVVLRAYGCAIATAIIYFAAIYLSA